MYTLLIVFFANGKMEFFQMPGFTTDTACDDAMRQIIPFLNFGGWELEKNVKCYVIPMQ